VCMYIHKCVCTYICVYVHTYVCMYIHMYVYTYICIWLQTKEICQPGLPYFSWCNLTKLKNIDINIFHSKAFQNKPKFGNLVCKWTIWKPCWHQRRYYLLYLSLCLLSRPKVLESHS
jgi:hypothetical protein